MSSHRPVRHPWVCESLESRYLLASPTPVVIDLLAVYTPGAAADDGGDAHLQQLIQETVGAVNQAMVNSQVPVTVRLVHVESINYTSSGDLFTDRMRLETPGDGYMDNVFALRNQYGADLVTLITDAGGGTEGGNADLMDSTTDPNDPNLAFSAIDYASIGPGNLTMAHELGHNLGAGHERNNPTEPAVGAFPYSYGYRFSVNQPGVLQASFNDIMSYAYDDDIPLFQYANPNISIDGVPTGLPPSNPNSADLYDTFLQTAPIVANYRSTVVADTTPPTVTLFETDRVGSSLTFTIRYGDDSGVDLSTIGNGDVTVSGPGGFVLPATFVSMSNPTVNGAYKFATYHVTLPATNPATSSLSFNLLPNAIKDINGNVAPAGAIAQYTGYYAGSPIDASGQYASYQWAEPLSSNLAPGATFTEYGSLGPDDLAHYYSFTLTQSATVEVNLSGFSADCNLYVTSDANHDDLDDDTILTPNNGGNTGTGPEDVALTLAAGTYYVHVDQPTPVRTGYVLTVRAGAVDMTPPTAVADTKDLRTSGAPYVDFAVTYSDNFDFDGVSARFDAAVDIHAVNGNYTFYYYPDPDINPYYYADGQNVTIYYRVYAFNSSTGFTAANNDTYVLSVHDAGAGNPAPQDAAGNKLPLITLGSFKIDIGNADTTPPTASLSASTSAPVPGQALWTFNVLYKDNGGLNTSSLGNSNLLATGPGGYSQFATFVSATPTTNIDGSYLATYTVPAPGGFWDASDAGTYSIAVQANQVKDAVGNAAAAASLGSVAFSSPNLLALTNPSTVAFIGNGAGDVMRLDEDANFVYFNLDDSLLYSVPRSLVPQFVLFGIGGNDTFDLQSGSLSGAIDAAGSADTLNVTGGTWQLDANGGGATPNVAVNVSTGGAVTFATNQQLASIAINGGAVTIASGTTASLTLAGPLTISNGGTLDIGAGSLLVPTTSEITTDIARAAGAVKANGLNAWTGTGLTSSLVEADAANGNAKQLAVGYFDSRDNANTGLSVPAGDTLVKETVYGDATGDGKVNIADLSVWNNNFGVANPRWSQGDFNYDGKVNIADLSVWNNDFGNKLSAPVPAASPAVSVISPSVAAVTAALAASAASVVAPSAATPPAPMTPDAAIERASAVQASATAAVAPQRAPVTAATASPPLSTFASAGAATTTISTTASGSHKRRLSPWRRIARHRREQTSTVGNSTNAARPA